MSIHNQYGIGFDDLFELVRGKITWKKCPVCDANGRQYWDGKTGEGVCSSPSGIDPEFLESDGCENCNGLGFNLFRN